jgi:hypothetical protein
VVAKGTSGSSTLKTTCVTGICVYFGLALALGVWFLVRFPEAPPDTSPRLPPFPFRLLIAFGAGLIGAIPGGLATAGLGGVRTRLRERSELLKTASGTVPVDGAFQAFSGRMLAAGPMLEAPLSGRECVLYRYVASKLSGAGRSSTRLNHASGYGLTPSFLDCPAGRIRLLAYLELEMKSDLLDAATARERLRNFLPTVPLFQPSLDLMAYHRELNKHLLDSDGAIHFNIGQPNAADTAATFEEQIVQHGDEVAIFGMYSAERGGIVADPQDEVGHRARLRKGDLPALARGFVRQAIASGIVGLLFAAVLFGWILLFFRHASSITL